MDARLDVTDGGPCGAGVLTKARRLEMQVMGEEALAEFTKQRLRELAGLCRFIVHESGLFGAMRLEI